jgi:hypothetical protein
VLGPGLQIPALEVAAALVAAVEPLGSASDEPGSLAQDASRRIEAASSSATILPRRLRVSATGQA